MKAAIKLVISVLMIIVFIVSHDLGYRIYTHYIAEPVSRGVTLGFVRIYGVILFPFFCFLIPFLRGALRIAAMLFPPAVLIWDVSASHPLRVALLVLCSIASYLLMYFLEWLAKRYIVSWNG